MICYTINQLTLLWYATSYYDFYYYYWAVPFIPIPLPEKVIQTFSCTILLYKFVLQIGMGMGINGTAQLLLAAYLHEDLRVLLATEAFEAGRAITIIMIIIMVSIVICCMINIIIIISSIIISSSSSDNDNSSSSSSSSNIKLRGRPRGRRAPLRARDECGGGRLAPRRVCMCIYIYIYICMYIYICIYTYMYMFIYMYTYIYIYTYIYVYTYIGTPQRRRTSRWRP